MEPIARLTTFRLDLHPRHLQKAPQTPLRVRFLVSNGPIVENTQSVLMILPPIQVQYLNQVQR